MIFHNTQRTSPSLHSLFKLKNVLQSLGTDQRALKTATGNISLFTKVGKRSVFSSDASVMADSTSSFGDMSSIMHHAVLRRTWTFGVKLPCVVCKMCRRIQARWRRAVLRLVWNYWTDVDDVLNWVRTLSTEFNFLSRLSNIKIHFISPRLNFIDFITNESLYETICTWYKIENWLGSAIYIWRDVKKEEE
jgi:hypothetical protein